jgi:hypothetical protein
MCRINHVGNRKISGQTSNVAKESSIPERKYDSPYLMIKTAFDTKSV